MNVPQEDLNLWRRFMGILYSSMQEAKSDLAAGRPEHLRLLLDQTADAAIRMGNRLEKAGALCPDETEVPPMAEDVPLRLLDTPANRRYAEKLREAWEAGLAVDRERYGDKIGTDGCAQIIEMTLADVEQEIYGPAGVVRE